MNIWTYLDHKTIDINTVLKFEFTLNWILFYYKYYS